MPLLSLMNFALLAFLGTTEILIILGLVVLLFGARKIPQLMKGFGDGVREFKRASRDDQPKA